MCQCTGKSHLSDIGKGWQRQHARSKNMHLSAWSLIAMCRLWMTSHSPGPSRYRLDSPYLTLYTLIFLGIRYSHLRKNFRPLTKLFEMPGIFGPYTVLNVLPDSTIQPAFNQPLVKSICTEAIFNYLLLFMIPIFKQLPVLDKKHETTWYLMFFCLTLYTLSSWVNFEPHARQGLLSSVRRLTSSLHKDVLLDWACFSSEICCLLYDSIMWAIGMFGPCICWRFIAVFGHTWITIISDTSATTIRTKTRACWCWSVESGAF